MKRQIMVIGLGRFGWSLAVTLHHLGYEVLAIDKDEKKAQGISSEVTHAVHADATDEEVLKDLDAKSFNIAVVAIGSTIQSSVMATLLLKNLEIPYVIARADDQLHGSILSKIGADLVVYPEMDAGSRLAYLLRAKNVVAYMPVASDYGITKLTSPEYMKGKKLSEIGFSPADKDGITPVLIKSEDEIFYNPELSYQIKSGDILVVAGSGADLDKILAEADQRYAREIENNHKE
jgi:trk system potassium uptake protein TrkA